MVRSRLRTLERKLVIERAEQRISFLVEQLVKEWDWAAYQGKPSPDPFDFIGQVIDEGFYLPTFSKAVRYLDDCSDESKVPDTKAIFQRLLPWSRYLVSV